MKRRLFLRTGLGIAILFAATGSAWIYSLPSAPTAMATMPPIPADVVDVMALATQAGPIKLYPALTVEPQATTAEFDAQHPEGADYVIVPAMSRDNDPLVLP